MSEGGKRGRQQEAEEDDKEQEEEEEDEGEETQCSGRFSAEHMRIATLHWTGSSQRRNSRSMKKHGQLF